MNSMSCASQAGLMKMSDSIDVACRVIHTILDLIIHICCLRFHIKISAKESKKS